MQGPQIRGAQCDSVCGTVMDGLGVLSPDLSRKPLAYKIRLSECLLRPFLKVAL